MKYLRLIGFAVLLLPVFDGLKAQQSTSFETVQGVTPQQGNWEAALATLEKRIAANPSDVEAQFLKGLLLFEHHEVSAAREVFLDIVRRFPRIPEAYNNLAAIYTAEGNYDKARQALLTAIANDYPRAQANLGDLYSKLAADAYREALDYDPADTASRAKLGLLERLFSGEQ